MNRDTLRVRELLPPSADPAAECGGRELLPPRAARELAELRRRAVAPPTQPAFFSRRRILVGATAAGVSAALAVVGQRLVPQESETQPVAYTPPVLRLKPVEGESGSAFLLAFAERVEKLPQERAGGAYRYLKTWGWWLNTAGDLPGGPVSAAVPTVTESWIRRDASGRQRSAYGEPLYPDPGQRETAEKAGLLAGTGEEDRIYGPGQAPTVEGDEWGDVAPFSTDPRELARQMEEVSWDGGMLAHGVSDLISYAARSGPVSPRLRAAALRVLARSRQVDVATTTTWQGRRVIAVSQSETYQGSTQRESVFFDPATGYPSGFESALFGNARSLNITVPATLGVGETLDRGWVSSTTERP
ncbi:CU044_5270 family protein [Streptomyces durbertensis]|uniref:CU044_5270 family protein n=1 Tax=Streptomyces durbertensis TaxID=2448886 RepID=A0ABR6ECU0_9ACTN|nr:CU044_5270 family protein [Streptomyces durbertensis]MBB1243145.1 CU044_5270 family protein [Streptomyces durbertensis]